MSKITRQEIVNILEIKSDDPGVLTLSGGAFTLRREYYWRPKKSPEDLFLPTLEKLKAAGLSVSEAEYGDKYTQFRGGEGVRRNSHYWLKFKVTKEAA